MTWGSNLAQLHSLCAETNIWPIVHVWCVYHVVVHIALGSGSMDKSYTTDTVIDSIFRLEVDQVKSEMFHKVNAHAGDSKYITWQCSVSLTIL